MKLFSHLASVVVAGMLFSFALSGCVALAVGAAAGVGGYAWINGELVKEYPVSVEKVQRATLAALKDLKMITAEQSGDRIAAKIAAKFADGKKVDIAIEAVTEKSAKLKIRVGMFGDRTRSELLVNAIEKHL